MYGNMHRSSLIAFNFFRQKKINSPQKECFFPSKKTEKHVWQHVYFDSTFFWPKINSPNKSFSILLFFFFFLFLFIFFVGGGGKVFFQYQKSVLALLLMGSIWACVFFLSDRGRVIWALYTQLSSYT